MPTRAQHRSPPPSPSLPVSWPRTRLHGFVRSPISSMVQSVEPAPPPEMYWSKELVWGALPLTAFEQTPPLLRYRLQSTELLINLILHLETMQWTHPQTQGDLSPPCRANSARLADCHNWWGRERIVLQKRARFRHPDSSLVSADVSPATTGMHHGAVPN